MPLDSTVVTWRFGSSTAKGVVSGTVRSSSFSTRRVVPIFLQWADLVRTMIVDLHKGRFEFKGDYLGNIKFKQNSEASH